MAARARPARSGFTLLEVVVAVAILALTLGAVMRVFSASLRGLAAAERHTVAALHAQSKLAEIGVEEPLAAGDASGAFERGYRWRSQVRDYSEPDLDTAAGSGMRAYEVTVSVTWEGGGEVTLSTLRLAPMPRSGGRE